MSEACSILRGEAEPSDENILWFTAIISFGLDKHTNRVFGCRVVPRVWRQISHLAVPEPRVTHLVDRVLKASRPGFVRVGWRDRGGLQFIRGFPSMKNRDKLRRMLGNPKCKVSTDLLDEVFGRALLHPGLIEQKPEKDKRVCGWLADVLGRYRGAARGLPPTG